MADVETNITLRAAGGDAAASEIGQAAGAIERVTASSGGMQAKFQERFQHMGLMLFAGDALRASGLGAETRMVITSLNMALTEGAAVAGISSGGFMLIVTALGALLGIAAKVIGHQKDMLEQSQKLIEADSKTLDTTNQKIRELTDYANVTGHLVKVQQDYLDALRETHAEETKKTNDDLQVRIGLLNQTVEKQKALLAEQQAQVIVEDRLRAQGVDVITNYKAAVEKTTEEIKKNTLALREAENQMHTLHTVGSTTFKDLAQAATAAAQTSDDVWKKYYDDLLAEDEQHLKQTKETLNKEAETVKHVADQIGGDLGNAFAKSLVEGKSFTEEMQKAFQRMAEQIIADIVRMIMEWMVFSAMSGMGGPVGRIGMAGLSKLGFATGGQVMVDQPTLFLAGEAGPEMATFTPLSAMGSPVTGGGGGGGGTTITIGSVQTVVNGVNDPDAIADQVGRKIIQQIRGSGQLGFVRSA